MEKPPNQSDARKSHEKKDQDLQLTVEVLKNIQPGINFLRGEPFIYESVNGDETDEVNEKEPAKGMMIPTNDPIAHYEGIYQIYLVGIWKGVPEKYKPILIAHELKEHDSGSHDEALKYEMEIARHILSHNELEEYKEWRKQYDEKI